MIYTKVKIPNKLKILLSEYNHNTRVRAFLNETADDTLRLVRAYGVGVSGGKEPRGGAPVWQGKVGSERKSGKGKINNGHYRGYLSESHYIIRQSPTHIQIASSAEFVNGVLEGYSTNWSGITFGANRYPKRAVDSLLLTNLIGQNWERTGKSIGR